MGVLVLIVLLIAAALGILGAVVKLALILVLAAILAVVGFAALTYYYIRYRLKRLARDMLSEPRGHPARGYTRDEGDEGPDSRELGR